MAPLRILVVDDALHVREFLTSILTKEGHHVETAENGKEGYERFSSGSFDLVVTDFAMPVMTGNEMAVKIKSLAKDTPVIMVTSFGDLVKDGDVKLDGVDMVLDKPMGAHALKRIVDKIRVVTAEKNGKDAG